MSPLEAAQRLEKAKREQLNLREIYGDFSLLNIGRGNERRAVRRLADDLRDEIKALEDALRAAPNVKVMRDSNN